MKTGRTRLSAAASIALRAAALSATLSAVPWAAGAQSVVADEPRAFGYSVGDIVERHIELDLPGGLTLDRASLPAVGGRGKPLELRSVSWDGARLHLSYQIFLAPSEVRTLEMPAINLRVEGGPRVTELRVDAWPVTVAPLVPVEVSPRTGLGDLRPDAPAPLIDTTPAQRRLVFCAVVAAVLLAWLAHAYLLLPWRARQQRPFGLAWKALRAMSAAVRSGQVQGQIQGQEQMGELAAGQQTREAWEQVHAALNRTAGEVVFEPGLDRFVGQHPRFAPLKAEFQEFFRRSRAVFFAADPGATERGTAWLLDFCRRCRDAERGAA